METKEPIKYYNFGHNYEGLPLLMKENEYIYSQGTIVCFASCGPSKKINFTTPVDFTPFYFLIINSLV